MNWTEFPFSRGAFAAALVLIPGASFTTGCMADTNLTGSSGSTEGASVGGIGNTPPCKAVFLNFDAVELEAGAVTDARENQTIIVSSNVSSPAFAGDETTRAEITAQVETVLAPFGVTVTRARPPASIPYTMIVFGGDAALYGHDGAWSSSEVDCDNVIEHDVGLVYYNDFFDATWYARLALRDLGIAAGLDGSSNPEDCMCTPPSCSPSGSPCAFSANSPGLMWPVCAMGLQDGPALVAAAYGCL